MQSALDQFIVSIGRVRELIGLQAVVQSQSTGALDSSDMLRASLVLAVSALDYYVHEIVILGMLDIHRGHRREPVPTRNTDQSAFSRFRVSLGSARQDRGLVLSLDDWLETEMRREKGDEFMSQPHPIASIVPLITRQIKERLNNLSWLESELRERFSYQSFQQADKIAEAIRYISDCKLWDEVSAKLNGHPKDIKNQLSLIVDRRNKIAHEADINPTFNIGDRWDIDRDSVIEAVDFIEKLVRAIHDVL